MVDPTVTAPARPAGEAGEAAGILPPYIVLACSSVFFWSLSVRTVTWTLMPAIAADLGLSTAVAGMVISGNMLGNNLGTWSSSWLPGSRKQRILTSTFLSLLAAALVSTAGDLGSLLVLGFAMGLAGGVYLPLGMASITDAGGASRKALYMSVHEVVATISSFCGATFVAMALYRAGWRPALLMWCAVGVLAVLIFSRVRSANGRSSAGGEGPPLRVSRILLYCCVSFAAASVLMGGLTSVLPLVMVRGWGVDPAVAASVVGYTRLAGLLGNLIVGLRADRWGHIRVALGLEVVGLAGVAVMSVTGFGPLFIAGVVAVAVGSAGMVTVLPAAIANAFPPAHRERAMAVSIGAGGMVGSVLAPALFGALVDLGLPNAPMMLSFALVLVGLAFTGRIPARPPRAPEKPGLPFQG